MPELPEVETVVQILKKEIKNTTILGVEVLNDNIIEGDAFSFIKQLKNKKIKEINRKGKFLVFHLSESIILISHLRMEGKFFTFEKENARYNKHDMVIFHLSDNLTLIYNDTRRFGRMQLRNENDYLSTPPLNNVGLDPLEINDNDLDKLYQKFHHSQRTIKETLLDQSLISGLGNIYVDETLYAVEISPFKRASAISFKQFQDILRESKRILKLSISLKGSTIKSYHPGNDISGSFQDRLLCYGHKDLFSDKCSHRFYKTKLNGRGTTYCRHLQHDGEAKYLIGINGKAGVGKSTIANYFIDKGFAYISADNIVLDLYQRKDVIEKISKIVDVNLNQNEAINKKLLREILLNKPELNVKIQKFLYPLIYHQIEFISENSKEDKFVVEVPLMYEAKCDELMHDIIYVDCPLDLQIAHLKSRNANLDILKINRSYDEKNNRLISDYVIENNGSVKDLKKQLDSLYAELLKKNRF